MAASVTVTTKAAGSPLRLGARSGRRADGGVALALAGHGTSAVLAFGCLRRRCAGPHDQSAQAGLGALRAMAAPLGGRGTMAAMAVASRDPDHRIPDATR